MSLLGICQPLSCQIDEIQNINQAEEALGGGNEFTAIISDRNSRLSEIKCFTKDEINTVRLNNDDQ